jgi:hypothetical protein
MNFKPELEQYRVKSGHYATENNEPFGAFQVPYKSNTLLVIADNGETTSWEHVSVSLTNRCPNWEEMCYIKSLFWSEEETVIEYHPPKSQYVNCHQNCLHLWRKIGFEIPLPPMGLVG